MQFTTFAIAALATIAQGLPTTLSSSSPRDCHEILVTPSTRSVFDLTWDANYEEVVFTLGARLAELPGPCTLLAKFEPGFRVTNRGDPQIRVTGNLGSAAPGSEVGSFRLESPTPAGGRVINSFQCADVMSFDFAAENIQHGDLAYFDGDGVSGLFIQIGNQC